ncbi:site-specific integrase [Variovorax sp. RCC_210]|uniref:site-specific integrase n=1 Tax=Variovorax sp. RCC_210 TaxID=3239217 RepID=UPI00352378CD
MATKIETRVGKGGTSYRAKVRKGGVSASRTFKTESEAKKWVTVTEAKVITGAPVDTGKSRKVTLGQIFSEYIAANHSLGKISDKKVASLRRVAVEIGKVPLMNFDTKGFEAYLDHKLSQTVLPQAKKKADHPLYKGNKVVVDGEVKLKTYAPSTIRHVYYDIRTALFWHARGNDYVFNSKPFDDNSPPPAWPRPRERRLEGDELERLLAACDRMYVNKQHLKDIIHFQIYSCMRMGETLLMKWKDLRIDPTEPHGSYVFVPKENQKRRDKDRITDREVAMRPELYRLVVENLLPRAGKLTDLVFPFWESSTVFGHRFKVVCKNAGVEDFHPHDFRHEGISDLFERTNLTDIEISKISGHLEMNTLQRYAKLRPKKTGAKLWSSFAPPTAVQTPQVSS